MGDNIEPCKAANINDNNEEENKKVQNKKFNLPKSII